MDVPSVGFRGCVFTVAIVASVVREARIAVAVSVANVTNFMGMSSEFRGSLEWSLECGGP